MNTNEALQVSDEELCEAIANDPFHQSQSQFEALYGPLSQSLILPPEDTIWVDPDLYAAVDDLLDVEVDVEVYPSEDSMLLVDRSAEFLAAAAATEALLGAPSPIDAEAVEDIRYRFERSPACFSAEADTVRFLIHAIDKLEQAHLSALVELNRTVIRLKKQLEQ
jgi:hypothetical protein